MLRWKGLLIQQTLFVKSKKLQILPGKYEIVSRKSSIPQRVSAKSQKSQTVSGKFEPMLS
jgi:hypothetical protein